jgi:hypothetical protein
VPTFAFRRASAERSDLCYIVSVVQPDRRRFQPPWFVCRMNKKEAPLPGLKEFSPRQTISGSAADRPAVRLADHLGRASGLVAVAAGRASARRRLADHLGRLAGFVACLDRTSNYSMV